LRICNGAAKEGKIDYFWRSATAYTLVLGARRGDEKIEGLTIESLQLIDRLLCLKEIGKILKIIIMLFLGALISCENDDILAHDEFLVIVDSESDLACSLPVIRFLDKVEKVKEKTSLETLTYNAHNLDSNLNITGTRLLVKFTETASEDFRVCNTLGIGYPWITIIEARLQN
jgi:hypothetical protein